MNEAERIPRRRSRGIRRIARSLWFASPGVVETRSAPVDPPQPGHALVRTLFSGISRGTERLVLSGAVGASEWERMRAPLQEGQFPFPVKYGYCAVGVVEAGPEALLGRTVFCLHPHQDCFVAPVAMLTPVPDGIPARRATLAANMETALNALWDSGAGPGDRIVVVGAGVVGLLVATLAAGLPGSEVTVIDVADERRGVAEHLGARFVAGGGAPSTPTQAADAVPLLSAASRPTVRGAGSGAARGPIDADIVFHASASGAGLDTAIACAGLEAAVVELSWYGDREVPVRLGGAFHSRRLRLVSSQVGQVSPGRRPRWDHRRRLATALQLLADPRLDALVADEIAFEEADCGLPRILAPGAPGLAPVIRYPGA